jgi:hypothetical protein
MKLTITRLRSGTNYKTPLHDIMDSFYELYKEYIRKNPQHTYGVCNFGWDAANRKKLDDILDADVVIIPSENEFFQHIKGYVDPRHKERSDEFIQQIGQHLAKKHVIIMRSDRADNEELYRTRVFKDQPIGRFSTFDEMDIPGGLHGMKYHFIKDNMTFDMFGEPEKEFDFIYWGCDKRKLIDNVESGDERHLVFKQIKKENTLKAYFIGKYNSIVPDKKIDSMYNLLPILRKGKSTLCFNWLDPVATTSRYHEAIACGILPFVWKNYDTNNTLIADPWQRVESVEELYSKMQDVDKMFPVIENYYEHHTMKPKSWYYEKFEQRMNEILK